MTLRRLVSVLVLALLVSGCSLTGSSPDGQDDGLGGELQANRWVLRSYQVDGALVTVPDDQYADADFRSSRVDGFSGCGDYSGVYRSEGSLLLVSMVALRSASCGADDRYVPVDLSETAWPESFLQHPCRCTEHPRAGSSRPPGIRPGAAQPAPRIVGRRVVRHHTRHAHRADRGHGPVRRLPAPARQRVEWLQHVPGDLHARTATWSGSVRSRRPRWPARRMS